MSVAAAVADMGKATPHDATFVLIPALDNFDIDERHGGLLQSVTGAQIEEPAAL